MATRWLRLRYERDDIGQYQPRLPALPWLRPGFACATNATTLVNTKYRDDIGQYQPRTHDVGQYQPRTLIGQHELLTLVSGSIPSIIPINELD